MRLQAMNCRSAVLFFNHTREISFWNWERRTDRMPTKITIPALASARETLSKEVASSVVLQYGITESFSLGISGKYMIDQDYQTVQSGIAFAGDPGKSSHNQGFYDVGFQLGLRILGTRTEEWFVNLDLGFLPGIVDSNNFLFTTPNNQFLSRLIVGKDNGSWSTGVQANVQYYAPSVHDKGDEKNNQLLSSSLLFTQIDSDSLYVRLSAGVVKFLDSRSNENAVMKQFFPAAQTEIGFPFSDTCVLSARMIYVAGAEGDIAVGGFNARLTARPFIAGSLSLLTRF
jgi:hypothetical protein